MSEALRILVVEDNPADADLIREMLPHTGPASFQVESAARLAETLTRLQSGGIDLVLLDLGLPDSQGLPTLRRLHAAAPNVPVIILTGTDDHELDTAAVQAGAQDYLVKGQINENLLVRSIRYALERHAAAVALRESEQHFSQMFHSSPVAMSLSTLKEGRYLDVNAECLKMFGGSREEVIGHTASELGFWVHPEQRFAIMAAIKDHGTVRNVEFDIRTKSGQIRHLLWSVHRMDIGGESCLLGSALDITERKQAEEMLRVTQFTMEHSADAIFWLKPDASFVRVNQSACQLVGYSRGELLTMSAQDLSPAHPPAVWPEHWQELHRKKVLTFEAELRAKDGHMIPVEVTANYMRFENQEFNCAFIRDISERKQKTDELRWKTAFLEALVHSSVDGITVVDNQGKKIFQNQRVADLWKIPPDIAGNPDDRVQFQFAMEQTKDPADFAEKSRRIVSSADPYPNDEFELKDGMVLDRHTYLVRDHEGKSFGRVWIFHDVTKTRQLEAQYRQAQKMEAIGTLAGGIAHDFNNILAAMFGFAYLLQQDTADNRLAQESVEEILKAAKRAKDLVQQILTFGRQREQKRQVMRMDTVVKEATKFLRASLPAQIKIELDLAADTPAVLADPTQIYQVTMNLATNALHAMEAKPGQLTVKLDPFLPDHEFIEAHAGLRPEKYARLTIADTGTGMDSNILEHIFEPFFTTKPVGKGTGLGLAVVHGIVQSHEGVITVESEVGQGTTFCLYFPAQLQPETMIAANTGQLPLGRGQRVLLLDDETALTVMFGKLLRRLSYEVISTNSASEAIRFVRESPTQFDLVITDLNMPEFDGLEVARQVRKIRPNLPVVLASGYSSFLTAEILREAGICELLEKPVALPALAEVVHRNVLRS
jgi:PAS domain S-box-containing protein